MSNAPAPVEGANTRARATIATLTPLELSNLGEDESDDDLSEPDEELGSQGTEDTQVVTDLNVQGMAAFDDTRCLVELSLKVKGHSLLCGHLKATCRRRKHQELQSEEGRRGRTGYYQQLLNRKGEILDAAADTYMTHQTWIAQRQSNQVMLERLGKEQSAGKTRLEEELKSRSDPVVRIDTTPRGPHAQQIQA
jgi:hypothetical protein